MYIYTYMFCSSLLEIPLIERKDGPGSGDASGAAAAAGAAAVSEAAASPEAVAPGVRFAHLKGFGVDVGQVYPKAPMQFLFGYGLFSS